jgi:hypothetical protein
MHKLFLTTVSVLALLATPVLAQEGSGSGQFETGGSSSLTATTNECDEGDEACEETLNFNSTTDATAAGTSEGEGSLSDLEGSGEGTVQGSVNQSVSGSVNTGTVDADANAGVNANVGASVD